MTADDSTQPVRSSAPTGTQSMETAVSYGTTLLGTLLDHLGSFETELADQVRLAHRHLDRANRTHTGLVEAMQTAAGLLGQVEQRVLYLGNVESPHQPDSMVSAQLGFVLRRLERMLPPPNPEQAQEATVSGQSSGMR